MSERDKQKYFDAVDAQLQSIGIEDKERQIIVKPYVELIGYDLYMIFGESLHGALCNCSTGSTKPEVTNVIKELEEKVRIAQTDGLKSLYIYLSDGSKLTSHMKEQIPQSFLDTSDYEKLKNLAENIGHIFDGCLSRGGHTEESLKFMDVYFNVRYHLPFIPSGNSVDYYNVLIKGQDK